MQAQWRVLITGTNKGIGNDLVKIFLKRHPQAEVYATSREEPADAEVRWKTCEGGERVVCKKLEMASEESIGQFVEEIKVKNVQFDVVVNNAGISRA
jgi:NAD(P)-dependent dehydrogenase (short-subunit alcohol dehydrogenase family)